MRYLNYAALCPTRPEAQQACDRALADFRDLLYSDAGVRWYEETAGICRSRVADLVGVGDPSAVAFLPNATMGGHLALTFIDWRPGDVLLTSTHENPSVVREMTALARHGVEVLSLVPRSPDDLLQSVETQLSAMAVRAMVFSHVSHVDGRIFPIPALGDLARDQGVLFLVDGAQAVGQIPVDLARLACDGYFFPGHKWCQGPLGTGAMVLRESFADKCPAFAAAGPGWNGTPSGRFEIGTANIGLIAGLAEACRLKQAEGLREDERLAIRDGAIQRLRRLSELSPSGWDGPQAPGMFTIRCRDESAHDRLMEQCRGDWDLVVKEFRDYPPGEAPAIRLSWLGAEDAPHVVWAMDRFTEALAGDRDPKASITTPPRKA